MGQKCENREAKTYAEECDCGLRMTKIHVRFQAVCHRLIMNANLAERAVKPC